MSFPVFQSTEEMMTYPQDLKPGDVYVLNVQNLLPDVERPWEVLVWADPFLKAYKTEQEAVAYATEFIQKRAQSEGRL